MNAHKDIERLAQHAYEAYCLAAAGKSFNGDPLPGWAEIAADPAKTKQRDAWISTANAARNWLTGPQ